MLVIAAMVLSLVLFGSALGAIAQYRDSPLWLAFAVALAPSRYFSRAEMLNP